MSSKADVSHQELPMKSSDETVAQSEPKRRHNKCRRKRRQGTEPMLSERGEQKDKRCITVTTRPVSLETDLSQELDCQASANGYVYSFFTFPAELRNIIYELILSYPECSQLYSIYNRQLPRPYQKNLCTPTILLLCKKITAECIPILKSQTLVIDRLPPFRRHRLPQRDGTSRPLMNISDFVGRITLQNISHLDLNIGVCQGALGSAWLWKDVVNELHEILFKRNRLVTLRLLLRVCDAAAHPANLSAESKHANDMIKKIRELGDAWYSAALRPNLLTVELWTIEKQRAAFEWGRIYHPPNSKRYMERPPDRFAPDREMFPGSITEFLRPLSPPYDSD